MANRDAVNASKHESENISPVRVIINFQCKTLLKRNHQYLHTSSSLLSFLACISRFFFSPLSNASLSLSDE